MKRVILSGFLFFTLVACSNMSVNQYVKAKNWIGLADYDVEAGNKARTFDELKKLGAMNEGAQEAYQSAYKMHVKEYCIPQKAFKAGILGKARNSVCIDGMPLGHQYEENWKIGLMAGDEN